jgi:hypothetical protein
MTSIYMRSFSIFYSVRDFPCCFLFLDSSFYVILLYLNNALIFSTCVLVIFSIIHLEFPFVLLLIDMCHICMDFSLSFSICHLLICSYVLYLLGFILIIRWTFPEDMCFTILYLVSQLTIYIVKNKHILNEQ